jgi:hypothetical protein
MLLMEIIGWLGSIIVVWAYAAVSLKKLSPDSLWYSLSNLIAGILLTVFTLYKEAYPPATVNSIWVIIAFFALLKRKKT